MIKDGQGGQGMIEYVIAVAAVAMLLLVRIEAWGDRNVIELVRDTIKGYYQGYAYAVSLSDLPDMVADAELLEYCEQRRESEKVCDNALNLDTHKFAMELVQGKNLAKLPSKMPTPDWESILLAGFNEPDTSPPGNGGGNGGNGGNGGGNGGNGGNGGGNGGNGGGDPPGPFKERDDGFLERRSNGDIVIGDPDDESFFVVNGVETDDNGNVVVSNGPDAGTVLIIDDGVSSDPDARKVRVETRIFSDEPFRLVYDDTGNEVPGVTLEETDVLDLGS